MSSNWLVKWTSPSKPDTEVTKAGLVKIMTDPILSRQVFKITRMGACPECGK